MQRHRSFIATGHDLLAFDGLPTNVMVMQGGTLIDITGEYKARQDIEGIYEEYVARTDP
jgi:hypothetical protein